MATPNCIKYSIYERPTDEQKKMLSQEWTNFYCRYNILNHLSQNVINHTVIEIGLNKNDVKGKAKPLLRDLRKYMLHVSINEAALSASESMLESTDEKADAFTASIKHLDDDVVEAILSNIAHCEYSNPRLVARIFATILELLGYYITFNLFVEKTHLKGFYKNSIRNSLGTTISNPYRMLRKLWFTITDSMACKVPHSIDIDYHIYQMKIPDLPGLRTAVEEYVKAASIFINKNIAYEEPKE